MRCERSHHKPKHQDHESSSWTYTPEEIAWEGIAGWANKAGGSPPPEYTFHSRSAGDADLAEWGRVLQQLGLTWALRDHLCVVGGELALGEGLPYSPEGAAALAKAIEEENGDGDDGGGAGNGTEAEDPGVTSGEGASSDEEEAGATPGAGREPEAELAPETAPESAPAPVPMPETVLPPASASAPALVLTPMPTPAPASTLTPTPAPAPAPALSQTPVPTPAPAPDNVSTGDIDIDAILSSL